MSHPRPHDDCHRRIDTLLTAVQTSTDRAQDAEKALFVIRNRPENLSSAIDIPTQEVTE